MSPVYGGLSFTEEVGEHLTTLARRYTGNDSVRVVLGERGAGTHYDEAQLAVVVDPDQLAWCRGFSEAEALVQKAAGATSDNGHLSELTLPRADPRAPSFERHELRRNAIVYMRTVDDPFLFVDYPRHRVHLEADCPDDTPWEIIGIRLDPRFRDNVEFAVWRPDLSRSPQTVELSFEPRSRVEERNNVRWIREYLEHLTLTLPRAHPDLGVLRERMSFTPAEHFERAVHTLRELTSEYRRIEDPLELEVRYGFTFQDYGRKAMEILTAAREERVPLDGPHSAIFLGREYAGAAAAFYGYVLFRHEPENPAVPSALYRAMRSVQDYLNQFIRCGNATDFLLEFSAPRAR